VAEPGAESDRIEKKVKETTQSARWRRANALFAAAAGVDHGRQEQVLEDLCPDDADLRAEVRELLQAHVARGFVDELADRLAEPRRIAADPLADSSVHVSLIPGTRIGPYEVTAQIGAGGMGEVYRATDTKLKRQVAIKVLPTTLTTHPDRLVRFQREAFQREAEVLASLNHPNIAHVYGPEEADGVQALVMELVEGPTLADRIVRGPLPVDEAFPIARQIAEALEAAHEQAIIHRDLKPANIKIKPDGTVKVLDFGLAKLVEPPAVRADASQSPTITTPAVTIQGVILGTAAYMSPEQVKGKPLDTRADIWAFGCVLYEMLTGKRAFQGEKASDTLAMVLKSDPSWSAVPSDLPPSIHRLLRRCLEKDLKLRLRDAGTAFLEIHEAQTAPAAGTIGPAVTPVSIGWRRSLPALGALFGGIIAGLAVWSFVQTAPPLPTRIAVTAPAGVSFRTEGIAVSPDGRTIVFGAESDGRTQLYRRTLDQLEAVPIPGTEDGQAPFFSPDGVWIGFFTQRALKKVSSDGGSLVTLCTIPAQRRGATWRRDDTIIFAYEGSNGLWSVPAAGGGPVPIGPAASDKKTGSYWPDALPDGDTALVTVWSGSLSNAQIAVHSLETGERQILLAGTFPRYAPTGHIVYWRQNSIWAVPFDAARQRLTGSAEPVIENVEANAGGLALFAVARDGSLAYRPSTSNAQARRTLVWVDRQGREEPITAPVRAYVHLRISPDGTRIALDTLDQDRDIWFWDFGRQTLTRVTSDPGRDRAPVWTPDGHRVLFSSERGGASNLFWQAADDTASIARLTESPNEQLPVSVSPEGARLVFHETGENGNLMMLALDKEPASTRKVQALIRTPYTEINGEISPDGRWLAYESNHSGQFEVYVRPFPNVDGGLWQVSTRGGTQPLWARNGQEVFYRSPTGAVMSVRIARGPIWTASMPMQLLEGRYFVGGSGFARTYDVSPDGRRFLMIKEGGGDRESTPQTLTVVLNWFEELKRLVPTK
jgi:eukaryotic-like serine/threonine-protein kinase